MQSRFHCSPGVILLKICKRKLPTCYGVTYTISMQCTMRTLHHYRRTVKHIFELSSIHFLSLFFLCVSKVKRVYKELIIFTGSELNKVIPQYKALFLYI